MIKIELEMHEQDISNVLAIMVEHEENMKVQMNKFKPHPDGTWNEVHLANFGWYQGHVQYLENLRKKLVAGIKQI